MGVVARIKQGAVPVAAQGVVDVLTGTVDSCKRFFVEQADHAVAFCHAFQCGHDHLVVVGGNVGLFVNRSDFELSGGYFVVTGLYRDSQFVEFVLNVHHERKYAAGNCTEVVVIQFLSFSRLGTEKGSAGHHEVGACKVEVAVNEEVFLFGTGIGSNAVTGLVAENLKDALCRGVNYLSSFQQRGLFVESLAFPGNECGGDAEESSVGIFKDIGGAGYVPCGVSTSLKGRAQAAVGELDASGSP